MRKLALLGLIVLSSCAATHMAQAAKPATSPAALQTSSADHVTVPFSDPSRPGTLHVDLNFGAISVKAYSGKDVIVDAEPNEGKSDSANEKAGLHRIPNPSSGLQIEEQDNVITIGSAGRFRPVRVTIQVPARTNLRLRGVNGGPIEVDGVDGDMEINNTNGRIKAENVSGSVLAHSVNGGVVVSMRSVTPGKALSFISTNGTVDVTLPANTKANAKMHTTHGEIWTDFDMQMKSSPVPATQDSGNASGTHRIVIDRDIYGAINGGGSDLTVTTLNGSIYIRKAK